MLSGLAKTGINLAKSMSFNMKSKLVKNKALPFVFLSVNQTVSLIILLVLIRISKKVFSFVFVSF